MFKHVCFFLLLLIPPLARPDSPSTIQPLFDSNEILTLTLTLPFYALSRDRVGDPKYHDAVLSYDHEASNQVSIPVQVRARGKTRRDPKVCKFPPLRLRLRDETAAGTLFEHQRDLKLVTHCQNQRKFDRYVLKEYLAYRIYNLLTDISIRPRLLSVRYVEEGKEKANRYGILLEDWRMVAERTGLTALETTSSLNQSRLSAPDINRLALFQYLISNDDWSVTNPVAGNKCCHNTRPLLTSELQVVSLPYDFDYSGLVNTPYSVAKNLHSNVRTRRFAGLCTSLGVSDLSNELLQFTERRTSIELVVRSLEGLGEPEIRKTISYLDGFFDVISDPVQVQKKLIGRCKKG